MQQRIGNYQILEEIASGGQATVYRAWDTRSGIVVALKVLHAHLARDPAYLERFHREARLASSISHPNVIRIFEVGQEGGAHFVALEYLSLSLYDLAKSQGRFPVERAVDIARQVALALEAARLKGIVHRDIKPQNILLAPDGTVKVTDFGIARAMDLSTMTRTGAVMGTPHYMSPEQAKGLRVDIRSDLYALGVVLYQMLTGRVLFDADTPWEIIRQHVEARPPRVRQARPEVPQAVESLVHRCLEKEPSQRYQSPQEIALALERAMPGLAPRRSPAAAAPPPSPSGPGQPQVAVTPSAPPRQPPRPPAAAAPEPQRPSTRWMSAWAGAWAKAWERTHRRPFSWRSLLLFAGLLSVGGVIIGLFLPPILADPGSQEPKEVVAWGPIPTATAPLAMPEPIPTAVSFPAVPVRPTPTSTPVIGTVGPQYGGTLRLALPQDPFTTNTPDDGFSLVGLLFSRLVRYQDEEGAGPSYLALEPDLAEGWEEFDGGRAFVFNLRKGVRFHDGSFLTADDVAATLESMRDWGDSHSQALRDNLEGVDVVNDYKVVVRFHQPYSSFLEFLASPYAPILPKSLLAEEVTEPSELIGTGPFRIKEYRPNDTLVLERNPYYFKEGLPYLEAIEFFFIQDETTRLDAFKAGRVDFFGLRPGDGVLHKAEARLADTGAVLYEVPMPTYALWFGTQDPPFNDERGRRAVNRAFDPDLWIRFVLGGEGEIQGPVPSLYFPEWSLPSEEVREFPHSPKTAKRLLAEAGYGDGLDITLYAPSDALDLGVDIIPEMLQDIGVHVTVEEVSLEDFAELMREGYDGMAYAPMGSAGLDVGSFLFLHYSPDGDRNYSHITDDDIEEMLQRQRQEADPDRRREIIHRLQTILVKQDYLVPLPAGYLLQAHSARVQGFSFHPSYDLGTMLEQVWLSGEGARRPKTESIFPPPRYEERPDGAVAALPWSDDFNSSRLDEQRWEPLVNNRAEVRTTDARLFMEIGDGVKSSAGVRTRLPAGDFDLQVRYLINDWGRNGSTTQRVALWSLDKQFLGAVGRGYDDQGPINDYYGFYAGDQPQTLPTSDREGVLCLIRSGNTLTGYYLEPVSEGRPLAGLLRREVLRRRWGEG